MDKSLLVITEHFASNTVEERAANLQVAVDRYLFLALKNTIETQEADSP